MTEKGQKVPTHRLSSFPLEVLSGEGRRGAGAGAAKRAQEDGGGEGGVYLRMAVREQKARGTSAGSKRGPTWRQHPSKKGA